MKSHIPTVLLIVVCSISALTQEVVTLDQKLAAAKTRQPLLQDRQSGERARAFQAAMAGVNEDPEVKRLHQALGAAHARLLQGQGDPRQISELSAALEQRQLAVLDTLHPELTPYTRARLTYRNDLLKLHQEHRDHPESKARIAKELKQIK